MYKFLLVIASFLVASPSIAQDYLSAIPDTMASAACKMSGDLDMNSKIAFVLDPRNYVKESPSLAYLVLKQYNAIQKLPNADKVNEIFVADYFQRTLDKCPGMFTLEEKNHFLKEIRSTKLKYSQ